MSNNLPEPITREEIYLNAIAQGESSDLPSPVTREEIYLKAIAENGSGTPVEANPEDEATDTLTKLKVGDDTYSVEGATDYTDLDNKPSINSVTLSGNKTSADLGVASASTPLTFGVDSNGILTVTYDDGN